MLALLTENRKCVEIIEIDKEGEGCGDTMKRGFIYI
jgi:hypothetical protein